MAQTGTDFMPLDRQLFRRRISDALTALVSQKHGTSKQVARAYGIDPSTAENMRKGHLSVPTLEKVAAAEGWAVWAALGEEMFGHSYAQYLHSITEEQANVQRARERERDVVRSMEAVARHLGHLPSGSRP